MSTNQGLCGSGTAAERPTPVTVEVNFLQGAIGSLEERLQILSQKICGIMSEPCTPDEKGEQPERPDITCEVSRMCRDSSERVTVAAGLLQDMIDRCQL